MTGNGDGYSAQPVARRSEVSSPPHRAAGIGLDEASMPASFPSQTDWRFWFDRAYRAWLARSEQLSLFEEWTA